MMISIEKVNEQTYRVTVQSRTTTRHTVTLSPEYAQQLTGGSVRPEALLEESFRFLLEREPNTSILERFDLPLIGRYFPEYEELITKRLSH
jgi:hypothetical protein